MKPERREILMQILNEWELKNKSFDWMDDAVCKGVDTSLFFFELGDGQKEMAAAKAVCVTCPVQQDCLVFAVDNGFEYGVWGGMSSRQRKAWRIQRNKMRKAK
jgi:WhiB family redox-sensing transcriptional regulator